MDATLYWDNKVLHTPIPTWLTLCYFHFLYISGVFIYFIFFMNVFPIWYVMWKEKKEVRQK